ncbi:7492_t:CDS:1, partial [Funneliformis caledonium]
MATLIKKIKKNKDIALKEYEEAKEELKQEKERGKGRKGLEELRGK